MIDVMCACGRLYRVPNADTETLIDAVLDCPCGLMNPFREQARRIEARMQGLTNDKNRTSVQEVPAQSGAIVEVKPREATAVLRKVRFRPAESGGPRKVPAQ